MIMIDKCQHCQFKSLIVNAFNLKEFSGNNCTELYFKKGEIIFKEGALSLYIAYLKKGLIKLHMRGPAGRDQIIKIVKAPNYFGIPTSIGDKINQYSATAIEPSTVCFINLDVFKNMLLSDKDFAFQIIVQLCKNEVQNFKSCTYKIQKHTPGLLADVILNFATNIYNSMEFELPLTRQELADLIGTSRENASRTLSSFQRDGIIKINKNKITILDIDRLIRISGLG